MWSLYPLTATTQAKSAFLETLGRAQDQEGKL
jgi:hypothetical protein